MNPSSGYTWVEPFAGAAAVALRLAGGANLTPLVSWMGGKRRYAGVITRAMGVPRGRPARVLLADAGPWGWVWPVILELESAAEAARVLDEWSAEHPRELWERLSKEPPFETLCERAAQWLWLQARSASGVPIWWDAWRGGAWVAPNGPDNGKRSPQHKGERYAVGNGERWEDAKGRPVSDRGQDLRWPGHQETQARWQQGSVRGGAARGREGGMTTPTTIGARALAVAEAFERIRWDVLHGDALLALEHLRGSGGDFPQPVFCYLDPPYVGATGYGWDCGRSLVEAMALSWARQGAVVAVSEAEPLQIPGWFHLDLTRPGGKPEWLTLSERPLWSPARQLTLFAGKGGDPLEPPFGDPA